MSKRSRNLVHVPRPLQVLDATAPLACRPLATGPIEAATAAHVAARLKALGDPARVRLMSLLLAEPAGCCTCDLAPAVGLSEPTVSHHLKVLRDAGLVTSERHGMNVFHSPVRPALSALCRVLDPECC